MQVPTVLNLSLDFKKMSSGDISKIPSWEKLDAVLIANVLNTGLRERGNPVISEY